MNKSVQFAHSYIEKGSKVTTDSRAIPPKSVFVALRGGNFDGNNFALEALSKGAQLAIVSDPKLKEHPGCLYTENTLEFLQSLAQFHRSKLPIPVIGLTGTNGKTTTKELINAVLATKYRTFATTGNLNNHIGVPLSVLSIGSQHQMAVIEMGANHKGEIELLSSICQPTDGIITNIGRAHLEGFGSLDGVINAKTELYQYLKQTGGRAFFNADNPLLVEQIKRFGLVERGIPYGIKPLRAKVTSGREARLTIEILEDGQAFKIDSQLTGSYNCENIMAAWCIGRHFGIPPELIVSGIGSYAPSNGRSQIVETKRNTIILDAYNANPTSMEAALDSFASMSSSKPKVVILGPMLELGAFSEEEHRRIALLAAQKGFERVLLVGNEYPLGIANTMVFGSIAHLVEELDLRPIGNRTVLLKGSRGARMEQLLEIL